MTQVSIRRAQIIVQEVKEFRKKWLTGTKKERSEDRSFSTLYDSTSMTQELTLNLDFNVDASRQFDALERIDCLVVWLDNVDETLVNTHFKVLA